MNPKTIRGLALLAALLCLGAGGADEDPLEPPELGRYLRWGPLRVRPGFTLSNLGYDDNVFFASGDQPPVGDYRVTLAPRLEGLLLLGDVAFLEFDERMNYTIYRELGSQNFGNNFFRSRITFPFSRMGLFADLDLFHLNDRATSELDQRLERTERLAGAGLIFKLGWRTSAIVEHTLEGFDYNDPDTDADELLNRHQRGNHLTFDYRLSGQTRLTLGVEHQRITFDDQAVDRDSTELRWLAGIRFGEGGRIGGEIKYGVAEIDLDDPTKQDFDGPVGEGELVFRVGRGTTFRLAGWRRVGFAIYNDNNFYLDTRIEAGVTHFFNRTIGASWTAGRGRLTFPTSQPPQRVDHITDYEGRILFRMYQTPLGQQVEYFLSWNRYRRTSDPPNQDLNQSRGVVGFGVNYGF